MKKILTHPTMLVVLGVVAGFALRNRLAAVPVLNKLTV